MDKKVGIHSPTGKIVYQCGKSRLLYFLADPPRRYVSTRDVELTESSPSKPCPKKKKK